MNVAFILASLALAGCDCAGEKKEDAVAERPAATAEQPAAVEEQKREPTEAELRVQKVRRALADQGLDPQVDETLPTRLGNREECRPTERRRYNLAGELVYVIVGTYPDAQAAEACIQSYAAFIGDKWPRFQNDFYVLDRYVIELNPTMSADQKERAGAAVKSALAE